MNRNKYNILYVDDEKNNLVTFRATFKWDYNIFVADSGHRGIEILEKENIDLIIADNRMPVMSGYEFFRRIAPEYPDIILMILTGYLNMGELIKSINEFGIYQYLTKPWNEQEMKYSIEKALETYQLKKDNRELIKKLKSVNEKLVVENYYLKEEIKLVHKFSSIVTHSAKFIKELEKVEQVAPTKTTVLIRGESGTGKELIARAIHKISNRSTRPLLTVNCAALPSGLIESELFGHEKGTFTGATSRRRGRFELAEKGTIFLDEIGEMPLDLQAKLLRVIQEGEFERLGGEETIRADVRIISATNRNLEAAIENNLFREDLYYRLNVFPITCIPLRERKEDIPLLAAYFLNKYEPIIGKKVNKISTNVMNNLTNYHWPGNIRELENTIERSMIISKSSQLELGDWGKHSQQQHDSNELISLFEHERKYILKVMEMTSYKISGKNGAAEILDINPKTLYTRLVKLGIKRPK